MRKKTHSPGAIKKILFVSGSLNRGGAQRVITLLANEYASIGWSVHFAVLLENKIGYDLHDGIIIHDLVNQGKSISNVIRWILGIRKIIKKENPDVIVSFVGRVNIITLLAAQGRQSSVLVSERNDPMYDRRSGLELFLCKFLYSKAGKVVFQTHYQAEYYKKWCRKNSVIIGNPISAFSYAGEHKRKDIICVGKLMDQKNHPMMISAFKQISSEFPDKHVLIYGEGEKKEELEKMIVESGLDKRILLCGNISNIFEIMREYEYFVMCSNYEGLSNALLEAMISGMICISTTWNGIKDVIIDCVNGYLVPVGDINSLADKLKFVLRADNNEIRQHGIETGEKYSCENILNQWKKVICSLL